MERVTGRLTDSDPSMKRDVEAFFVGSDQHAMKIESPFKSKSTIHRFYCTCHRHTI